MRVFLTGANGFIGSRIVSELRDAGHAVLGLTRSDAGAAVLEAAGAEPFRGDLADPASLARGAAAAEAVVHTAFDHDFSRYRANCEADVAAIRAMVGALDGPFVLTSITGVGTVVPGVPAREDDVDVHHANPRAMGELAARALAAEGADVRIVRLSQIHDRRRQGLVTSLVALARATGVSAVPGAGDNRWSAAPLAATARLYRLALERGVPGGCYHATAEEGVPFRAIAETVGARLALPVRHLDEDEAAAHFGWLNAFATRDMSASSALTQERLGWRPDGPTLLEDVADLVLDD